MFRAVLHRSAALTGVAALVAMLASNLWCESACVAEQSNLEASLAATCHEAQSSAVAISGHHDCRDHLLESLTATTPQRAGAQQLMAAIPSARFIAPPPERVGQLTATTVDRSPPPLIRPLAVLRI